MCCFEDQVTVERCRTLFNRPLTMVVPFIQGNLGILWNIHEYSVFLTTPGSSAKWVDNGGYSESKPRYSESVCPHDSWISWSIKVHQCRSETVGTLHPHGSTPWICSFERFFFVGKLFDWLNHHSIPKKQGKKTDHPGRNVEKSKKNHHLPRKNWPDLKANSLAVIVLSFGTDMLLFFVQVNI